MEKTRVRESSNRFPPSSSKGEGSIETSQPTNGEQKRAIISRHRNDVYAPRTRSGRRRDDVGMPAGRLEELMSDRNNMPTPTVQPQRSTFRNHISDPLFSSGESETPKLIFTIDPGTTKYACCFRLVRPGIRPTVNEVVQVLLPDDETSGPMVAAWHNGKFYFGKGLEQKVEIGEIPFESVIRLPKISLYEEYKETEDFERIHSQLNEATKTPFDLWMGIFQHIWSEIQAFIGRHPFGQSPGYVSWSKEVYIAVPTNVSLETTSTMAKAAEEAGLPQITFVYEPWCAAAYNLQYLIEQGNTLGLAGKNDELCIIDAGGGTVDVVSFTIKNTNVRGQNGARSKFELVRNASGDHCGSVLIDRNFLRWLSKEENCPKGSLSAAAQYLGWTVSQLVKELLKLFEKAKRKFGRGNTGTVRLDILGGPVSDPKGLVVVLDQATIRSFFDPVVERVLRLVREQQSNNTKGIIATGGFGQSAYLKARLRKAFGNVMHPDPPGNNCFFPVSHGAALRFDTIDLTNFRSSYSFGVLQDEDFIRNIHGVHKDGFEREDRVAKCGVDKNGDVRYEYVQAGDLDHRVVFKDPMNRRIDKVIDRIQWLVRKDSAPDENGWLTSRPLWQIGYICPKEKLFVADIIVSREKDCDLRDSEPLRDKVSGNMRRDFHILARIKAHLGDGIWRQYKKVNAKIEGKRRQFHEVYATVILRHNGMVLEAGFHIAPPKTVPYNKDGSLKDGLHPTIDNTIWASLDWPARHTHKLWDAKFDPGVHDDVVGIPMDRNTVWACGATLSDPDYPRNRHPGSMGLEITRSPTFHAKNKRPASMRPGFGNKRSKRTHSELTVGKLCTSRSKMPTLEGEADLSSDYDPEVDFPALEV